MTKKHRTYLPRIVGDSKPISFDGHSTRSGPCAVNLWTLFYRRFFELAPDRNVCSPSTWNGNISKLMDMIAAIVRALDERELFQSIISHTGRQHARLGVRLSHFDAFGHALI